MVSSCALLKGKEDISSISSYDFKSALSKLCFTGEGKGRIVFLSERQSFSYESLLEVENYTWSLGLEVPMLGQELFRLNYKNALEGKVVGHGNFYERLRSAAQKEKQSQYHLEVLDSYLNALGRFLLFRKAVLESEIDCSKGSCSFVSNEVHWNFSNSTFLIEFPMNSRDDSEKLLIEAKDVQKDRFSRLKMQLTDPKHRSERRKAVEIDLTLTTCEQ